MNFLADEGVDRQIVDRLRAGGHEVYYAKEQDADMASGGNLLLAGTGITPKTKTDVGLPLIRNAVEPIHTGRVHEQHKNLG